jgi:hypothetical protein
MKNKWIKIQAGKYFAESDKAAEVKDDAVAKPLHGDLNQLDAATFTALKKKQWVKVL